MPIGPVRPRGEVDPREIQPTEPVARRRGPSPPETARPVPDRGGEVDPRMFVGSSRAPITDRGILYVGFNAESERTELAALGKFGRVRAIVEPANEDFVDLGGTSFELGEVGGIEAFAQSLGLDPRVQTAVEDVLRRAAAGSREKLAQIAVVFAEAERGAAIPSRLVVSGHSGGLDVFGDRGVLRLADLTRLARAMPRAAASIEDVHLSACSTAGQAGVDDERAAWRAAFPNLKTMWAYAGSAPRAPARHLEVWGRATARPHDRIDVPADVARQRVAVWSQKEGYRDQVPTVELRAAQRAADSRFERFLSGDLTAGHLGPTAEPQCALADYQTYRVLGQKNELAPAERAALARKADQLLRIRYYEEGVRTEFQRRYGGAVRAGFAALELDAPDFGTLSRRDALARIATFEETVARRLVNPAAAATAARLLRGLRDLDAAIVLEADCHH